VSKLSIIFDLQTKKIALLLSLLSLRAKYKQYFVAIQSSSILKILGFTHFTQNLILTFKICFYTTFSIA
jgi:hypothetical protein